MTLSGSGLAHIVYTYLYLCFVCTKTSCSPFYTDVTPLSAFIVHQHSAPPSGVILCPHRHPLTSPATGRSKDLQGLSKFSNFRVKFQPCIGSFRIRAMATGPSFPDSELYRAQNAGLPRWRYFMAPPQFCIPTLAFLDVRFDDTTARWPIREVRSCRATTTHERNSNICHRGVTLRKKGSNDPLLCGTLDLEKEEFLFISSRPEICNSVEERSSTVFRNEVIDAIRVAKRHKRFLGDVTTTFKGLLPGTDCGG